MALVDPNIAMSFRQPEFRPRNALADYAQVQQIQSGQRQAEVADMQLESLRRERDALSQIQAAIVAKGGPPDLDAAADAMIKTGRPEYVTQGMAIHTARRNQRNAEAYFKQYGGGAAPTMPSSTPGAMTAPAELAAGAQPESMAPVPGVISASRVPGVVTAPITAPTGTIREIAPGGGMGAEMPLAPANALAPAAPAPVNAMVAPAAAVAPVAPDANATRLRALEAQYRRIGNNPELASEKALILKQIEDVQQTIRAESATPSEAKFMRVLGIPLTRQGFIEFEALKQNPTDFERLLSQSGLPKADQTALIRQKLKKDITHAPGVSVNTQLPASEEAQKEFMKEMRQTFSALKQAPTVLDNIEKAKALVPQAKGFMGAGGESILQAASFLNNRLGTTIDTKGVQTAEELRSRLFLGIMDNLKKLDSQPSQQQQAALQVALGSIGTDPSALPRVLDVFGDTIRQKVDLYNEEALGAESRGVKFPYNPTIKLQPRPAVEGAGRAGSATQPRPAGVDAAIWNVMTPQERALWQK